MLFSLLCAIALLVFLLVLVENEHIGLAVVIAIVAAAAHDWLAASPRVESPVRVGESLVSHPYVALAVVALWIPVGLLYMRFRWRLLCRKALAEAAARPDLHKEDFKPRLSEHKELLVGYVMWWPLSGLWFMIHDSVEACYESMVGVLKRDADRVFDE